MTPSAIPQPYSYVHKKCMRFPTCETRRVCKATHRANLLSNDGSFLFHDSTMLLDLIDLPARIGAATYLSDVALIKACERSLTRRLGIRSPAFEELSQTGMSYEGRQNSYPKMLHPGRPEVLITEPRLDQSGYTSWKEMVRTRTLHS